MSKAAPSVPDSDDTESNPSVWEGNFPRKMMDLQWNFSATPCLAACTEKHWSRLHATSKTLVPDAQGNLVLFKQKIPHLKDDELLTMVKRTVGTFKKRELPPLPPRPELNTPLMRQRLKEKTVLPLPKRPFRDPRVPPSDASSIFSTTSLGTVATGKLTSEAYSRCSSGKRSSAMSGGSVAGSGRASGATGSIASSKRSQQRVEQLEAELEHEKAEVESLRDDVSRTSERLAKLEKLLENKEKTDA